MKNYEGLPLVGQAQRENDRAIWTIACPYCHTLECRVIGYEAPSSIGPRPEIIKLSWSLECLAGHTWLNVLLAPIGQPMKEAITDIDYVPLNMTELNALFERQKIRKQLTAPIALVVKA